MTKSLQQSIRAAVQKAWFDTVSTITGIEQEMGRRLSRIRQRADLHQAGEEIQRGISEMGKHLQDSSEAIEQRVEESIRTVLDKVRSPLVEEINGLRSQAEQLSQRIERLLGRQGSSKTKGGKTSSDAP